MIKFEEKQFLEELEYLVNIDSGSGTASGIRQIASFFADKYQDLGMEVKQKTFDPMYGPCVEAMNHPESEQTDILLLCHMDTVFPVGTAQSRPFYVRNDKAYGAGVADMKSGMLLAFALVENILRERPDLNLCVALNSDNEVGAVSSREWIRKLARNSKYCLGFEAGRTDGSFVKSRKGAAHYLIKMYGKSAHAGIDPRGGASAVLEMANWICRFADFDRLPLGTSLNFGVVNGGTMYNVIPDYAESRVDIRFETEEQYKLLTDEIHDLSSCPYNPEIRVTAECLARSWSMIENAAGTHLVEIMRDAAAQSNLPIQFVSSGGASDASIPSQEGVGTIDACGPIGYNLHNDNEYILISSIQPRLELLMEVCRKL